MPATGSAPAIPVPNQQNILSCLNAIRNWIIASTNTDGGRANLSGTVEVLPAPSQFTLTQEVINLYEYPVVSNGAQIGTVTIPQLVSLTLTNAVTGETWTWTAPGALTAGGSLVS